MPIRAFRNALSLVTRKHSTLRSAQTRAEAALEITRESLQQRFSDLADAELLRRTRSGALTELAHEVALDELAQRGISPDAIDRCAPVPTVGAELEFPTDEFDRNPYQAPRAPDSVRSASLPAPQSAGLWNALWWIYIGYLCLMVLIGLAQAAIRDTIFADEVAYMVIYGLGAAGLAAWRLRCALFHPTVWVVCLAAGLALLSSGVKGLATTLNATDSFYQHNPLVYLEITFAVLNLALFWGLARYTFLSPSIWRRPAISQRTD